MTGVESLAICCGLEKDLDLSSVSELQFHLVCTRNVDTQACSHAPVRNKLTED